MTQPVARQRSGKIPDPLQHKLALYGLAAGAAGVTLLALVQPSQAEVVYTAAYKRVNHNSGVPVDFNHDGVDDFILRETSSSSGRGFFRALWAVPTRGGGIFANDVIGYASDLPGGAKIGPAKLFFPAKAVMIGYSSAFYGTYWGLWAPQATDKYLGVKFLINGQLHYGWARVTAKLEYPYPDAILTGYAYETIPGRPIQAGDKGPASANKIIPGPASETVSAQPLRTQPASLGALALGAAGLSIWRRKETASSE